METIRSTAGVPPSRPGTRVLNEVRYSLVYRSPERDLLLFAESTGHR